MGYRHYGKNIPHWIHWLVQFSHRESGVRKVIGNLPLKRKSRVGIRPVVYLILKPGAF